MRAAIPAIILYLVTSVAASAECLTPYTTQPQPPIARKATEIAAADVNGDGRLDLIGSAPDGIFLALNVDGTFASTTDVLVSSVSASAVGDLDGDSVTDIVAANGNSLQFLKGRGDATFAAPVTTTVDIAPKRLEVKRVNGGSITLFALDPIASTLVAYVAKGDGTFLQTSRSATGADPLTFTTGDFDRDGWPDALVTYTNTSGQALYGSAGGFSAPVTVPSLLPGIRSLASADLTGDGLPDLAAWRVGNVYTIRNLGDRRFSDPLPYATSYEGPVSVADTTGDGSVDVIQSATCAFRHWRNSGLGSLVTAWTTEVSGCYYYYGPSAIATGDFDGDGRIDVLVSRPEARGPYIPSPTWSEIVHYRNRCGDGSLALTGPPTISAGQQVRLVATLSAPAGMDQRSRVSPTAEAELLEGGHVVASAPVYAGTNFQAWFDLTSLAEGEHTFVARYSDAQYQPADSAPFTLHVTRETTVVSITPSPAVGTYGRTNSFAVSVLASDGTIPSGIIDVSIDANYISWNQLQAPAGTASGTASVGSHKVTAEFRGDATHPPSTATIDFVVDKQVPSIGLSPRRGVSGTPTTVTVSLPNGSSGQIVATDGVTTLATAQLSGGYASFVMPAMAAGSHDLLLRYSGDGNYAATTAYVPFVAFAPSTNSVEARGTADSIAVTAQSAQYCVGTVERRRPNDAWVTARSGCLVDAWSDTFPAPGALYLYRVNGGTSGAGPADVAMRITFTDDPLVPGTVIRAVHIQEIIAAVNLLRAAANLPLVPTVNAGSIVNAATVNDLRIAINEGRSALGAYTIDFGPPLQRRDTIRAIDFTRLREAVR